MSGSRSSSRQTSSNKNDSISIGIGGDNNGVVVNGNGNTVTDHNAVNGAIDVIGKGMEEFTGATTQIVNDAFTFAGGSQSAAYDFVDNAMDDMSEQQGDVFEWAAGQQQNTNQTALDFLDFADGETDDTLTFAGGLVGAVLDSNDASIDRQYEAIENQRGSLDNMLEWSGEFIGEILDSSENNQESLRQSHNQQIDNLSAAHNSQLANQQASHNQAMTFASGAFSKGIDTVTDFAKETKDQAVNMLDGMGQYTLAATSQMGDALTSGLQAVKDAGDSESAELNDKMLKGLGVGALVLTGLTIYIGRKK